MAGFPLDTPTLDTDCGMRIKPAVRAGDLVERGAVKRPGHAGMNFSTFRVSDWVGCGARLRGISIFDLHRRWSVLRY